MKKPKKACRILLVDDHKVFAFALGKHIDSIPQFELLGTASDGIEGLEKCNALRPDLAVIDVRIPKMDGLELADILLRQLVPTRVLILSGMLDPVTMNRARKIGVHGYVDKAQPFEILEIALIKLSEGLSYFSESFINAEQQHHRSPDAYHKFLSDRQIQILGLVANGKTNKQIADNLELSVRTVESHRYRMLQILELENPKELFRYAIDHGIGGGLS
ncbi:response regulator transcription factor [Verrucomicrobia bacterium]|mgnify:FL=1|jgi:DNA-binding NarL/FixJ family response regulator|nr:response regulator transcription factor [Verrucomicrobiota bacterium]